MHYPVLRRLPFLLPLPRPLPYRHQYILRLHRRAKLLHSHASRAPHYNLCPPIQYPRDHDPGVPTPHFGIHIRFLRYEDMAALPLAGRAGRRWRGLRLHTMHRNFTAMVRQAAEFSWRDKLCGVGNRGVDILVRYAGDDR